MLGSSDLMAFVATRDSERARDFYERVLGLRFVSDDPYAIVFNAHGILLRIQKVQELAPPNHTVLGWRVPDIAQAVDGLVERGVHFERYEFLGPDARGIWSSPSGAKVAWFKDPDGNTLSLTEFG